MKCAILATVVAAASAGPALEHVLQMAVNDQEGLAEEIRSSPLAAIYPASDVEVDYHIDESASGVPLVFAHGMGDSCYNSGMKQITAGAGTHVGSYAVCIGNGNNVATDTINGFLMNMDKAVDDFADRIQKDDKLKDGFVCVGFSQGNSLCRGYAQKHNDKFLMRAHLSVHGTISCVAGIPQCNPAGKVLGPVCKAVVEVLGKLAYNPLVQGILFQADYLRVPTDVTGDSYKKHSQIAAWNNEGAVTDEYKTNFLKVEQHILVKAMKDTMVYPNEGEWYGTFADGGFDTVLPMNQTKLYQGDNFGLKTADEAGKISFESTAGNHLDFTQDQLHGWLDKLGIYQQ